MKKILILSTLGLLFMAVLAGCTRRSYHGGDNSDYWLRQESGVVVYSDTYCPYIVVETYDGYTIMRWTGGLAPYEGDEVFGNGLSNYGYRDFYNYTDNTIFRGEVTDYWLTYAEAQYIIDNLCYTYSKGAEKKQIKQGLLKKK